MVPLTFYDLSIYYPIPLLTTEGFISLYTTLLMVAPSEPPPHVKEAISDLGDELSAAEEIMVSRIDENLSTALERSFDLLVDAVWVHLRGEMEFAAIYRHEGAAKFTPEDRLELELEKRVEESHIAANMIERMFANGVGFLRAPYPQQAAHMGARLDWITSKNYEVELEKIAGPKLVTLLKVCQKRYEAMVGERSSRDGKSIADLNELRNHLRCHLYSYCGAIGTLFKAKQPETAELVEAALRPILIAREQARRKALGLPAEPVVDLEEDEDEDEDEEVETETEAEEPTDPKVEGK